MTAPALMLVYGALRWVDGLDGQRKDGAAWDVGHVAFFVAVALFGVLAVKLGRDIRGESPGRRVTADVAVAAALCGAACFLWVIAGDLSSGFRDAAPLPSVLQTVGPILFQLGILVLLVLLAVAHPRRLPLWSPVLVSLGFGLIAVSLDTLPLASIVVGAGLVPLALPARRSPDTHGALRRSAR